MSMTTSKLLYFTLFALPLGQTMGFQTQVNVETNQSKTVATFTALDQSSNKVYLQFQEEVKSGLKPTTEKRKFGDNQYAVTCYDAFCLGCSVERCAKTLNQQFKEAYMVNGDSLKPVSVTDFEAWLATPMSFTRNGGGNGGNGGNGGEGGSNGSNGSNGAASAMGMTGNAGTAPATSSASALTASGAPGAAGSSGGAGAPGAPGTGAQGGQGGQGSAAQGRYVNSFLSNLALPLLALAFMLFTMGAF